MVSEVEEAELGDDHVWVDVDSILLVLPTHSPIKALILVIFIPRLHILIIIGVLLIQAKMLTGMLKQPGVVIVVFLFHETLLDNNRKQVCNNANWDENIAIKENISVKRIYLKDIVVGVPNHITMHQCKERKTARLKVAKTSTFPKDSCAKESKTDK